MVYRVSVLNKKTGTTEIAYTLTGSFGDAVKRVFDRIEDQTPIGELALSYTIEVQIVEASKDND